MTAETWRPPTVAGTIRKYALQTGFGKGLVTPAGIVRLAVLLVILALCFQASRSNPSSFGYFAFLSTSSGARMQRCASTSSVGLDGWKSRRH